MKPLLVIGGSGTVGAHAVRTLRRMYPALHIVVGARNMTKAAAVAAEIQNASTQLIDLRVPTLGIAEDAQFSGVAVLMKDDTLHSLKYAQRHNIPYMSFSDFAFEIGPELGYAIARPSASPILLLGHHLGGIVTLVTLHFAKRDFVKVESIAIGATFDQEDFGGPVAQADADRAALVSPRPLMLSEGRWIWADSRANNRIFSDAYGKEQKGVAYSMLDVISLGSAIDASSIRFDCAVRSPLARPDNAPAHDVVIELAGTLTDGLRTTKRYAIIDDDVHQVMSGYGAAFAIESLLGLDGRDPIAPGLYFPESIEDPDDVIPRLIEYGVHITQL